MKKSDFFYVLSFLLLLFYGGGMKNFAQKPIDLDANGGADVYAHRGDNRKSIYFAHPDFFHLKSGRTLTILPRFSTCQQTCEWSCGDACALMAVRYLGVEPDATELSMACALHTSEDSSAPDAKPGSATCYEDMGTKLKDLDRYFRSVAGLQVMESSYREHYGANELVGAGDAFPACDRGNLKPRFALADSLAHWVTAHIKAGHVIMVEWSDWDGHWQNLIGIDNNGTPDFYGDDVLVMADPYDTSDHWQDGYTVVPMERFMAMWKDRAFAPKPYQLQPYIVIGRCQGNGMSSVKK